MIHTRHQANVNGTSGRRGETTVRISSGKIGWLFVMLLCGALIASRTCAAGSELSPVGVWETAGGDSHVQIQKCGANLCGTIVWLKDPLGDDGKDATDSKNPDPSLRRRKIVGLRLLGGFEQSGSDPNVWSNGTIYDPDNGKTYSCKLTMQDSNTLRVRGFIGFSLLGATQLWTRTGDRCCQR